MKRPILLVMVLLFIAVAGFGCRPAEVVGKTDEQLAASTVTAQENIDALPTDVPIHPLAENLKFAAGNTYITYQVPGGMDTIIEYYRTELAGLGWEKKGNSSETPLGGALSLLRSKPDKNISVTIQSIPESENVRVLITVIEK